MLYLVGLGLGDEKDISLRGLEIVRSCSRIYLENYTSALISCTVADLEAMYGRSVTVAERDAVEQSDEIVAAAEKENVALLVIGDPLAATTHLDIMMRARGKNIPVRVIHNASIMTAVASTGLQLYKFGKTVTIPYPEVNFRPEMYYEVLKQNRILGLHTLLLLDLKPKEKRYMTVAEAIVLLEEIEARKKAGIATAATTMIGCARLGSDTECIAVGAMEGLKAVDFGKPPYCVVVPGEMHFMEEEALRQYRVDGGRPANQKI